MGIKKGVPLYSNLLLTLNLYYEKHTAKVGTFCYTANKKDIIFYCITLFNICILCKPFY